MTGLIQRDYLTDKNLLNDVDKLDARVRRMEEAIQITEAGYTTTLQNIAGYYLALPGLRGYWPLTHVDGSGYYLDLGGNGLTLTNNNNVYLYSDGSYISAARFVSASSTYLSRADEAAFDILGTELYVDAPYKGLTVGAWVNCLTLPSSSMHIISKWLSTGNQRSYALTSASTNRFSWNVSDNGTDSDAVTATVDSLINTWYFVVGRYMVATLEIDLWVNDTEYTNTTSIPSSLYSSSANFHLGASGVPDSYLNGFINHAFVCAMALPDNVIVGLYEKTRLAFGG